jgi:hypothetical protein
MVVTLAIKLRDRIFDVGQAGFLPFTVESTP